MASGIVAVLIARLHDHLPLCAHADPNFGDVSTIRTQQQRIIERMRVPSDVRASEPSRQFSSFDHNDIVYFVLSDAYSDLAICASVNKLLLQQAQRITCKLLDAVYEDFLAAVPRDQIAQKGLRAYHFIKFDSTLQKTINRVVSGKAQRTAVGTTVAAQQQPYDALKSEINDVHVVIRQNLDDLLTRGEKLEVMSRYSAQLKDNSGKYYKSTVHLNRMRVIKTYGPPAAIGLFLMIVFYWRFF